MGYPYNYQQRQYLKACKLKVEEMELALKKVKEDLKMTKIFGGEAAVLRCFYKEVKKIFD